MNYLIIIILLVISFALSFFYTSPLMAEISNLSEKQASLGNSLAESKNLWAILEEKGRFYRSFTGEEIDKLNKILPDSIDNVKLIIDIDDIASKYGMKIRNIDLRTERADDVNFSNNKYGTAILRFSVATSYSNFQSFLADLEDSLRLVDISSLSFGSSDRDLSDYGVELKTYWLKETN